MDTYFRIQDSRSELPAQSRNYWSGNDSDLMDGVSAFGDLFTASRDLLGREDVDGLAVCYADSVEEDGGIAVLSVFQGEDLEDESPNVNGYSVDVDRATERRFSAEQVLTAWKQAVSDVFGDNVTDYTWEQLEAEYELNELADEAVGWLK